MNRAIAAFVGLSMLAPVAAYAAAKPASANVRIGFVPKNPYTPLAKAPTWKKQVWGIPVASKASVERAMVAELRRTYGKDAKIEIQMSEPHGINLDFSQANVVAYARVWGNVWIDGRKLPDQIYADATKGKVQAFIGLAENDADDRLFATRGLPLWKDRFAVMKQERAAEDRAYKARQAAKASQPGVFAMGVGNGSQATLVDINGQIPGFTAPALFANAPLFNMWANMWGFTRVE